MHDLLYDLQDEDIDVTLTGFDLSEMEKIFQQQAKKGQVDEDDFDADAEAAAIVTPIMQPGDIWLVGRHRLMCGDSTDAKQMARLMDGKRARMIFTDPPWNVDYGGAAHSSWKKRTIMNDKMTREDFFEFLTDAAKSIANRARWCTWSCPRRNVRPKNPPRILKTKTRPNQRREDEETC